MSAPLDYQAAANYWRGVAARGAARPDFAAGLNNLVPEGAHRFCRAGQLAYFLREAAPFAQGGDVLDLGCGPGTFALAVAPQARSVLGVDVAPEFVEAAQREALAQKLPARFEVADFVHYQPQQSFSLIAAGSVLQYVGDAEVPALLGRVRQALSPAGAFYVRVSVARRTSWHRGGDYPAVYRSRDDYAALFARAGLSLWREAPDPHYTYGDLFAGYFSALRLVTLGASRRSPALEAGALRGLLALAPLTLATPEAFLRWVRTPVPRLRAHQFILRPAPEREGAHD
jgi:SAM-dependent methyltransferase